MIQNSICHTLPSAPMMVTKSLREEFDGLCYVQPFQPYIAKFETECKFRRPNPRVSILHDDYQSLRENIDAYAMWYGMEGSMT